MHCLSLTTKDFTMNIKWAHYQIAIWISPQLKPPQLEAWCKVGPGPGDPGTRGPRNLGAATQGPPQSLKVGPWIALKFKIGTLGSPSKFESGTPGSPSKFEKGTPGLPWKFKSGTLSPLFNEFTFFRMFHLVFTDSFFCLFLNKILKNVYCE